jgi:hypothetical protein
MASPNRTKEFIQGLIDNGSVAVPMNWVPGSGSDTVCKAILATGETVLVGFLDNSDGAVEEVYAGYLQGYGRTSPVQGVQRAEAMFRINGQVESV